MMSSATAMMYRTTFLVLNCSRYRVQTADSYLFVNIWWPSGLWDSGLTGQSNVIKTGIDSFSAQRTALKEQ